MLLSLSRRYAFLANGKAASSALEEVLGPQCEIASSNSRKSGLHPLVGGGGKHLNYRDFLTVMNPFLERFLPIRHYFVFGVMREPMSRLQSMFRFWTRPGKMREYPPPDWDFARFIADVTESDRARRAPGSGAFFQHDFFRDRAGALSLNYIIKVENMAASLEHLREETGLDFTAVVDHRVNVTGAGVEAVADDGLRRAVETHFARDYELYESSCDRLLNPWDRSGELDVAAALRWMAGRNQFEVAATMLTKLRQRLAANPDWNPAEVIALLDARS